MLESVHKLFSPLCFGAHRTTGCGLKILVEMTPRHYDLFLAKCDIASREYAILTSGVIISNPDTGERLVVAILCDKEEMVRLLYAATLLYPDAVPDIKTAIDRASEG